ncbi:MAG: polysaccharide biosynthesis protein [Oscillospiraceae bacterium]|nr:polysaccharide biosynthesis protein [Oscillospiraceae bacterium]
MKRITRVTGLIIADILTVVLASLLAGWIRFDFVIADYLREYGKDLLVTVPFFAIGLIALSILFNLYRSLWEYASIDELLHVLYAVVMLCAIQLILILTKVVHLPNSFPILFGLLTILFSLSIRFFYRVFRNQKKKRSLRSEQKRTMLIGAGNAGMLVLREFQTSEFSQNQVVCIVDDDVQKRGSYLRNVKICGGRKDIVRLAEEYRVSEIVYAIPAARVKDRKEILRICQSTGCRLKIMPGIFQLANGEVSIQKIREVDIMDLLGRESVEVDLNQIAGYLSGKTVLVTGGGGSIGSELCRQIAQHNPARLVIFDIYENNAYEIQQELKRTYPELNLTTLIGSVRDTDRVNQVFEEYRPNIVFHAAAHKHVPLMEESPNEAIKNNVFGTYHVAKAAAVYNAETFVLISTDKAVNPTNIMGASKRICEMIVQMMANASTTKFVAVRFGNVLGSNGSVIPLFKKQIAEGGPVTVTHPDIIRFFMTIPEAVSLVLQAGAYAHRGEIFVLDMGEPVKIDDLARNLIRLSGFEPDVDIEVKYTGLRPGEKLYEEMLMNEEGLRSTANNLIHIGKPLDINDIEFAQQLVQLEAACEGNADNIRDLVEKIVPTYHRPVAAN